MKRFMGLMPSDEVKVTKTFRVGHDQKLVKLQAGENGWTIIYADCSSVGNDVIDTVENNFNTARTLLDKFDDVNEILD